MAYLINETMVSAPSGTLKGNAAYISGSPSYLRLTTNAGGIDGELEYSLTPPATFSADIDLYANGSADAIFFYWGNTATPTGEDSATGGYIVAVDEYSGDVIGGGGVFLAYNGTVLASVLVANLGSATRRLLHVDVVGTRITVTLAGTVLFTYNDTARTLGGKMGLGARTGGQTAEHRVYSFAVYYPDPVVASPSNVPTFYTGIQNVSGKFQFAFTDKNGNFLMDVSGMASNRKLSFVRNGSYSVEFELDLDVFQSYCRSNKLNSLAILNPGVSQIYVKRLGLPIYGGQVAYIDTVIGDSKKMTIKTLGWLDLFKDRYSSIQQIFTATDAGSIAWQLINYSQGLNNGSFGITQGTIKTSVNRDRTYEFKPIRDAIVELSSVYNGFDFQFTWDKKFNVYYPRMGAVHNEFSLRYPGNIKELRVATDGSKITNYNIVRGQGFGDGQLVDIRQDSASQINYGLRQKVTNYSDVLDMATLDAYGDEDVRISKNPIDIIELKLDANKPPYFGSYWLGDSILLQVYDIDKYAYINGYYKINQIDLDIDAEDNEVVTLKVANL